VGWLPVDGCSQTFLGENLLVLALHAMLLSALFGYLIHVGG
jgi:hypothetical protein